MDILSGGWREADGRERSEPVVAIGAEPFESGDGLHPAVGAPALEKHDDVDGVGDETARHGDDGFLDELLKTVEAGASAWSEQDRQAKRRPVSSAG